jgi:antitoxin component YwqK of YwqJK toxin-antitoxin module
VKLYHDNGLISSEGVAIYEESVQFDFYRFGLWRFYDEQGNLLRTENYPEGKLD